MSLCYTIILCLHVGLFQFCIPVALPTPLQGHACMHTLADAANHASATLLNSALHAMCSRTLRAKTSLLTCS